MDFVRRWNQRVKRRQRLLAMDIQVVHYEMDGFGSTAQKTSAVPQHAAAVAGVLTDVLARGDGP